MSWRFAFRVLPTLLVEILGLRAREGNSFIKRERHCFDASCPGAMPSLIDQRCLHNLSLAPRLSSCYQRIELKRHAVRSSDALKHRNMLKFRQRIMGTHTAGAGVELGSISSSETKNAWQLISTNSAAVTVEENSTVTLDPEGMELFMLLNLAERRCLTQIRFVADFLDTCRANVYIPYA